MFIKLLYFFVSLAIASLVLDSVNPDWDDVEAYSIEDYPEETIPEWVGDLGFEGEEADWCKYNLNYYRSLHNNIESFRGYGEEIYIDDLSIDEINQFEENRKSLEIIFDKRLQAEDLQDFENSMFHYTTVEGDRARSRCIAWYDRFYFSPATTRP